MSSRIKSFDGILNTERRSEFQKKSFFYRHKHPVEKLVVDYEFYTQILGHFDRRFEIGNLEQTARIWEFVLRSRNIEWKKEDSLTEKKFEKISQSFEEALIYNGSGVNCPLDGAGEVHEMAKFLLANEEINSSLFFRLENIKNVLWSMDKEYLTDFSQKLQTSLKKGFEVFQEGNVSEKPFIGFVYNIVALFAYAYPEEGTTFEIPIKTGEKWEMRPYRVDKQFQMSPSWFSSPLPIFGLVAEGAPPILSCMGTTYPAGKGFVATLLSDFTPGFSVGHAASLYGKQEIEQWLIGKNDVIVAGVSLGGAISLHLSRHHSQAISKVYAFNPAGLYPCNWRESIDHGHITYHIYSNDNDLVSTMGFFPEGKNVNVYRILLKESENCILSHTKNYHASDQVTMIQTSSEYENSRPERKILTFIHMTCSWMAFLAVIPFQLMYKMYDFLFRQISALWYDDAPTGKTEADHAEFFGSSAKRPNTGDEESPVSS